MARFKQTLLAIIAIVVLLGTAFGSSPAWSAAMVSPSFYVSNPMTTASGVTYGFSGTTATTGTVTKFEGSLPAGSKAPNPYLYLPGVSGNWASTPDSPANSLTGDLDIRVKVAMDDWTPAAAQLLIAKDNSDLAYGVSIQPSGIISLRYRDAAGTTRYVDSTAAQAFANAETRIMRVTFDVDNGSGQNVARFYTSTDDGATWDDLGAPIVGSGVANIRDTSDALEIGSNFSGSGNRLTGKVYRVELRNVINGAPVAIMDPNDAVVGPANPVRFVSSIGEQWTIARGYSTGADIRSNPPVVSSTGLPAGTTLLRYSSYLVSYIFSASQTVTAGSNLSMKLEGFTNPPNIGPHTIAVSSDLDTITTPFSFVASSQNTAVAVSVAPTLTFTISGASTTCNAAPLTSGRSVSASSMNFGSVSSGGVTLAQNLDVQTNAASGYLVNLKAPTTLASAGHTFASVGGTSVSPIDFPATGEAFGFTTDDGTLPGGTTDRFTSGGPKWAPLTGGDVPIMTNAAASSATTCVAYRAQASASTPAGAYAALVVYTVTPSF